VGGVRNSKHTPFVRTLYICSSTTRHYHTGFGVGGGRGSYEQTGDREPYPTVEIVWTEKKRASVNESEAVVVPPALSWVKQFSISYIYNPAKITQRRMYVPSTRNENAMVDRWTRYVGRSSKNLDGLLITCNITRQLLLCIHV
jgi:hypothetical protein